MSVWRLYHDSRGKVVLKTKRQKFYDSPIQKIIRRKAAKVKLEK